MDINIFLQNRLQRNKCHSDLATETAATEVDLSLQSCRDEQTVRTKWTNAITSKPVTIPRWERHGAHQCSI